MRKSFVCFLSPMQDDRRSFSKLMGMSGSDHTHNQRLLIVSFSSDEGKMVNSGFIRRQNSDSTSDVICLSCFRTIARSQAQADLTVVENNHDCNPLGKDVLFHSDELKGLQE